MSRILLIDDEVNFGSTEPDMDYMWNYTKAMDEAGHKVRTANRVDDALLLLRSTAKDTDVLVLDIMMPPGRALEKGPHLRGMRTGIHLALKIAKRFPKLPIVILTNAHDQEIQRQLGNVKSIRAIAYKDDTTPFQLVELLAKIS